MICHHGAIKGGHPAHGVNNMFIKSRKKAKAMLAWQLMLQHLNASIKHFMAAALGSIYIHRNAAGLAAGNGASLQNHHLKAPLN